MDGVSDLPMFRVAPLSSEPLTQSELMNVLVMWFAKGPDKGAPSITISRVLAPEGACSHCKGSRVDPADPGDWVDAVHQYDPMTVGPCPECNGTGKAEQPDPVTVHREDGSCCPEERVDENDPFANGVCSYGEGRAPGSGCIKPAAHDGPHAVVPGDLDPEDML